MRKTLCLRTEGVSKRYDGAYTGNEMTALGTVLFMFDPIMDTEVGSDSSVCTLKGVCVGRRAVDCRLKQELFSLPPSLIACRAQPVPCPVNTECYCRSVRHEADH